MPDQDQYPTEEELDKVKSWKPGESKEDFIEFLRSIWWMPDWGFKWDGKNLELHTGGWSGNESIIAEMRAGFDRGKEEVTGWFWSLFWVKSERGGHYYFEIPKI